MFNTLFIIAAIVEIPLVALFLKFYWPDRSIKSLTTKIICSLIFVLSGIFASQATGNDTSFATNMIWGLALGMVGDILLHSLTTNMLPSKHNRNGHRVICFVFLVLNQRSPYRYHASYEQY